MAVKSSLSGFPEWDTAGRIVEAEVIDRFRRVFELYGYAGLETRAVEPRKQLLAKGETSKEIYLLRRLQEDPLRAAASSKELGLHFDLTVPFARYVSENAGSLVFPFKRYQIQKVWRGERPQDGRFREFYQADIDVVADGELPFHYEVEGAVVMANALAALPLPGFTIQVNNRKVVQGACQALGITDVEQALRSLDKLDKIGDAGVREEMAAHGITGQQAEKLLGLAAISGDGEDVRRQVAALGIADPLLEEGVEALVTVLAGIEAEAPGVARADLRIARGLDYYTGTVYETVIHGHEDLGSVCSGGRYDSLASTGKRAYPGVGLSIGVSRLVSRLLGADIVRASRPVPTCVLVAVSSEADRAASQTVAAALRQRGIPTDVSPTAAKFGKQIKFADKRGIPYVWFPDSGQVKDIRSGAQCEADPALWSPPEEDLHPRLVTP